MSPLCGCSLLWDFISHVSIASHDDSWIDPLLYSVWWYIDLSLSVKMVCFHISILDSKFILYLFHISFSIAISGYAIFTFISLIFWMVPRDLVCSVWHLKSVRSWTIPGEDHHYLDHEHLSCIVLLHILATSSQYLLLLLSPITVLYYVNLCMKCSLPSIIFLRRSLVIAILLFYFFALVMEEVFLISLCYSL